MNPDYFLNKFENRLVNYPFVKENKTLITKVLSGVLLVLFFILFVYFRAPSNFPENHIVSIEEGLGLEQIATKLESEDVIRSPFWFKILSYVTFNEKDIVAGDYIFNRKHDLIGIVGVLSRGDYGLSPVAVTIPEGATVEEIGLLIKNKILDFPLERFNKMALPREGFLFPDTYNFFPNVSPFEVISIMEDNFKEKTKIFADEIASSTLDIYELVTLASIIEEEASKSDDRKKISGVLWNRLEINMPLQVDAVFVYYNGRNSYTLTLDDLREDHPYNTYTNIGLPPTPISNPGLDSIEAALRPIKSDYLFYLADLSGNTYYAKDFEGHQRNRVLYLNFR